MVFAQLVNRKEQSQSFVDSITGVEKPKVIEEYSFLDPFKVCFERVKKRQSEYAACMQAAVNETTQQKTRFKKAGIFIKHKKLIQ